jgi:hypothetical protein
MQFKKRKFSSGFFTHLRYKATVGGQVPRLVECTQATNMVHWGHTFVKTSVCGLPEDFLGCIVVRLVTLSI